MRTCGSGRGYPVGWYEWNAGGRTVGSCAYNRVRTRHKLNTNLCPFYPVVRRAPVASLYTTDGRRAYRAEYRRYRRNGRGRAEVDTTTELLRSVLRSPGVCASFARRGVAGRRRCVPAPGTKPQTRRFRPKLT